MDARSHVVISFNILFPKLFIAWANDNKNDIRLPNHVRYNNYNNLQENIVNISYI